MRVRLLNFFQNFSYTLISNLFSMIITTLVVLIVPKLIGVEEYGYWQLYLFYTTYVGFLHFGWNDGIYLRYGGKRYEELDKQLFFSQFYMLVLFQFIFLFAIFSYSFIFLVEENRSFIINMTALCMLITNVRYMLLYILQGTNRIKDYAKITLIDRLLYCILIIIILIFGMREYHLLILADIIGKFISLLYAMFICKDMVFHRLSTFYFTFDEAIKNLSVGIKLMFANIASKLIIGVIRFAIERCWSITIFGKISLTLSISNFLMGFINATGLVMFPVLRRINENYLQIIYITVRNLLMVFLLGMLIFYYPIKIILLTWLPNYADSIIYMAILFPIIVYEGKMVLLINTYLNTLRKERLILIVNIIALIFSIILSLVSTLILKNLTFAVLSIVIVIAFRSILGEICLFRILGFSLYRDLALESIIIAIFIVSSWFINSWTTVLIYIITYILYLFLKRKDLYNTIKYIKKIVGS